MGISFGQIIDGLTAGIAAPDHTVDRLEPGKADFGVSGIVTAFSASQYVVEQAIDLGANLIITHEGIYFSHQEQWPWRANDPVFMQKNSLITSSGIGIYRFHDYLHRFKPDGVIEGLLRELEWLDYVTEHQSEGSIVTLPVMEVGEIARYVKRKLQIPYVRVAGELPMPCARVGILVGYRGGGGVAIPFFQDANLDLIIAGEGPEWETPEYVRDAVHQGRSKALIMLGHAESEAPGMKYLAEQLALQYPGLPVHFVAERPVFQIV
ncbi:Nif3-like dinuclear metal center hexameric protein [Paenibacillus sp. HW567]|uniref:Nif3-like dinuclear metal center hexameric protein n=1 Tax=Paenibacillus sp. HW567 TaxID=1034769 RepID=UPI0003A7C18F|nr:Nif3-like dinuclear metal center hexameric protein [Paenibacillus sp. HW567]